MSRLSLIGKKSSTSSIMSGGVREAINMEGFFNAATTYLQLPDKDSLLNIEANLQVITILNVVFHDLKLVWSSVK